MGTTAGRRLRSGDQAQVTDASLLIVLTADLKAWKRSPERYWRNAAPEIQKLVTGWMGPFYEGKEQLQRDEAMRSSGIVGQTIMLAAKAMGYDSCPMIGFDPVKVAEIINLPSDHVIGFMIAVGKAVKPAMPKGGQLALSDLVVQDPPFCIATMTRSGRVECWPAMQSTGKMHTASGTTRPPRRVGNALWRVRNRATARHTVLPLA
jgi:hypothetical protein